MKTRMIGHVQLYFHPEDEGAADLIGDACGQSAEAIRELWGLEAPGDLRVYVMTSWRGFVFSSAPWPWKVLLAITMPLWAPRVRRLWPYTGGWAQRYGRTRTVGVKPPRLLQVADTSIGARIFVETPDVEQKARNLTCHELVHAFTDHLRLPTWLHEGLAMTTVDRFAGKPTVRDETLELLGHPSPGTRPRQGYGSLQGNQDGLVYLYVRGYWITRYLAATRLDLLRSLLRRRQPRRALEDGLAAALGLGREEFWSRIDGIVLERMGREVRR